MFNMGWQAAPLCTALLTFAPEATHGNPVTCLKTCMWVISRRSAAWWLGENANFGAGEYAWSPRPLTPELVQQLAAADGCSQAQMAAAAVAMNPVLALLIARLQRVMVTGLWEVRLAAAQVRQRSCSAYPACAEG